MNNIEVLKDIAQTTYDSVEGYRKAAEQAEKSVFIKSFERRRDTRMKTLDHLNSALQAKGQSPVTSPSLSGETHQLFLTLSDTIANGDDAVISRVEEGEEYLSAKFENALEKDSGIDASTRLTLQEAYRDVREGKRFSEMLEQQYA